MLTGKPSAKLAQGETRDVVELQVFWVTNFAQLRIFGKRIDNLAENVFGEQIVQQGCKRLHPSLVDYQKSVSGSKKPHIKRDIVEIYHEVETFLVLSFLFQLLDSPLQLVNLVKNVFATMNECALQVLLSQLHVLADYNFDESAKLLNFGG